MKYIILIILSTLISSCCTDENAEFEKNCPYDLAFTGHYLRIPITISPHQSIYRIGDTLNISTVFSDSIYDLGTQQIFQIENFPFKPVSLLYKINSENDHESGYTTNELTIAEEYNSTIFNSSEFATGYRAKTIYENGLYHFETQLVLKNSGRYVMLFSDLYQSNLGSGNSDLNAEADAISFEGQCDALRYYLCSVIDSGDAHLDEYEEELIYLDEEVYNDNLSSVRGEIESLGEGGIAVDLSGFFGFEVVE